MDDIIDIKKFSLYSTSVANALLLFNKNKHTFADCYDALYATHGDKDAILRSIKFSCMGLILEIINLTREVIDQNEENEGDKALQKIFDQFNKSAILPLDLDTFRKSRNLVSHNILPITKIVVKDGFLYSFNFGSDEQPQWVDIPAMSLYNLVHDISTYQLEKNQTFVYANKKVLEKNLRKGCLKERTLDNCLQISFGKFKKGKRFYEIYDMDNFEKNCMIKMLENQYFSCKKHSENLLEVGTNYIGLKNNASNLLAQKIYCLDYLMALMSTNNSFSKRENIDLTASQFNKVLFKKGIGQYQLNENFHAAYLPIFTNILYSSVANTDDKTRNSILKNLDLTGVQCENFRNSIVHGRYFYNYDNNFEMYDGNVRKGAQLEHISTVAFADVNKLMPELLSEDNMKDRFKTHLEEQYQVSLNEE